MGSLAFLAQVALGAALPSGALAAPEAAKVDSSARCDSLLERDPYLPPMAEVAALLTPCAEKGLAELGRGLGLLATGDLAGASDAITAAHTLLPNSPYPLFYQAELALRQGDHVSAERALANVLALRPDFAGAHSLLGDVHTAAGDKTKAMSSYRMAIALAPGRAHGHLDLGRACLSLGEPEHARVALGRALELDPNLLEARYLLGRAHLNSGHLQEGCAILTAYVHDAAATPDENDRVTRAKAILRRFADEG